MTYRTISDGIGYRYDEADAITVHNLTNLMQGAVHANVFSKLLDMVELQVLIKSRDFKYLYLNNVMQTRLNVPANFVPNTLSDEVASASVDQRRFWQEHEQRCIDDGRANEADVYWSDPDGRLHVNHVLNVPVFDQSRNVIAVAVLANDSVHRSSLKASQNLLKILQHDWVNDLLKKLTDNLVNKSVADVNIEWLAGLRIAFEFMKSYLETLPSLMSGYPRDVKEAKKFEFQIDIVKYMQQLAPVIGLNVNLSASPDEAVFISGDESSMRILCYELMKNHSKYGEALRFM